MSKMIKRFAAVDGILKGSKIEVFQYSDGSLHYSFRDRKGYPMDMSKEEAEKTIKRLGMVDVTERAKASGWIH